MNENVHLLEELFEEQNKEIKADRRKGKGAITSDEIDIEIGGKAGKNKGSFEGFGGD